MCLFFMMKADQGWYNILPNATSYLDLWSLKLRYQFESLVISFGFFCVTKTPPMNKTHLVRFVIELQHSLSFISVYSKREKMEREESSTGKCDYVMHKFKHMIRCF